MTDSGGEAVPGHAPGATVKRGRLLYSLDVDGEIFEVRGHDDGTDYEWVSGPNADYGFGTSGRDMPEEWHRAKILAFLDMIDPVTGYIADD